MKMKRIFIITSFFLVIFFGSIVKANQSLNEENESIFVDKRKIFFLYSDDNKIDDKLLTHTDELDLLAHNLFVFDNVKGDVKFGKPISIRNAPGLYYAPVFNDDSCIQFIKIGEDKYGNFSISMGFEFVQLINNLEDGTYYFESDIDTGYIYLRGNNIKICIDSDLPCNFENEFSEKDYVYKNYNEVSLNLYENISYAVKYQENSCLVVGKNVNAAFTKSGNETSLYVVAYEKGDPTWAEFELDAEALKNVPCDELTQDNAADFDYSKVKVDEYALGDEGLVTPAMSADDEIHILQENRGNYIPTSYWNLDNNAYHYSITNMQSYAYTGCYFAPNSQGKIYMRIQ